MITYSIRMTMAMVEANKVINHRREEFITPERLLCSIARQRPFVKAANGRDAYLYLQEYVQQHASLVPEDMEYEGPEPSQQFQYMFERALDLVHSSSAEELDVTHIIRAIFTLDDSTAKDVLLTVAEEDEAGFMCRIIEEYEADRNSASAPTDGKASEANNPFNEEQFNEEESDKEQPEWTQYVTHINATLANHNPLIGRKAELDRTIQVLCRKDKNNPLHVGEPGVGKTALVYGLTALIESGEVPQRLKGCQVFALDLGALMAGTQYRGDMEKRVKLVLDGVAASAPAILYMDEIHTIVGAGRVEGSTQDISNMLKPYLEDRTICFMGATTYDEYKTLMRSKAFSRRFEKIDIPEPSPSECHTILLGLKNKYEEYHRVVYTDEALRYAVDASAKFINNRFLPDKAIDLIDEAGAWAETHRTEPDACPEIGKAEIADVLARICKVDMLAEDADDIQQLADLDERIRRHVYGQDEAVREVTEAVQMASTGLIDDNKPMASLLFVGPTGVGKTEVAKVLAYELGVPLVRFDMSEYTEKHAVAKLIGAPAGYVGYEDGGLLTDAVRKTPHCVLLLDELEKANHDIYNILLQVMDYAVLTDNRGQKADFRHVVLIMTTNAGAQYAKQTVGFVHNTSAGEAMMHKVKATFKPEFLNRLTAITVFHDMDRHMASLVLDKKLRALATLLEGKRITLHLTPEAKEHLLSIGFSAEYGGREIERVVTSKVKPLLMRALLHGTLKEGDVANITFSTNDLTLST